VGMRSQPRSTVARASADDVVRLLRSSPRTDQAPVATVHQLHPAPPPDDDERFHHLPAGERLLLARALDTGLPVEIDYVDSARRFTTRVVEDLDDLGGLLSGWCRLRDDERSFSPEGIVAVRPVD
jgi:predicted DNA-binding transcriptional regulator YafY